MPELVFNESLCKGKLAFDRIAKLQNYIIKSKKKEVTIRIRSNGRIGLTFVFMIATFYTIAKENGKQLHLFLGNKIYPLYKRIQVEDTNRDGQFIGPGFQKIVDEEDIIRLVTQITTQAPVELDERVADILVSKIGEMFINALDHAQAKSVIGGKYFKHQKRFCFTCYDDGVGIPSNVKKFFNELGIKMSDDVSALKWAMQYGNTTKMLDTKETNVSRGIGLSTLQSFIKANDGALRICSGRALYILNSNGEHYYQINNEFRGTLFEIDIITDNKHRYILSDN